MFETDKEIKRDRSRHAESNRERQREKATEGEKYT